MFYCPRCGMQTYSGIECSNNDCSYPRLKSKNTIAREERRRRQEEDLQQAALDASAPSSPRETPKSVWRWLAAVLAFALVAGVTTIKFQLGGEIAVALGAAAAAVSAVFYRQTLWVAVGFLVFAGIVGEINSDKRK